MGFERTSVGLDVRARSVAATAIDGQTGEMIKSRLVPSHEVVIDSVPELPGPVAVVYEAGGSVALVVSTGRDMAG